MLNDGSFAMLVGSSPTKTASGCVASATRCARWALRRGSEPVEIPPQIVPGEPDVDGRELDLAGIDLDHQPLALVEPPMNLDEPGLERHDEVLAE